MIRLSASEARKRFSEVVNRVEYGGERAILQRHGKDVVAIVPIVDVVLLEVLEEQFDIGEIRSSLTEALSRGTTSLTGLRGELGLI